MTQDEVIKLADEWLKDVPSIRKKIRLIDKALKKNTYDMDAIDKIKQELHKLNYRLHKIIKSVSTLPDEDQRIICFRYFDKLSYKQVAIRVHLGERTIYRRIEKNRLTLGRIMFGFEDEFWKTLNEHSSYFKN